MTSRSTGGQGSDRRRLVLPDGEHWRRFIQQFESRFPVGYFELSIVLEGRIAHVEGRLVSDEARDFLLKLIRKVPGVSSVVSDVQVTGVLRPAQTDPFDGIPHSRVGVTQTGPSSSSERSREEQNAMGRISITDSLSAAFDGGEAGNDNEQPAVETVLRYPLISSENEPAIGRRFKFLVDLTVKETQDTTGGPVHFQSVPKDWMELRVSVEVSSPQLEIPDDDSKGEIRIFNDGESQAAHFYGMVKDIAPDEGIHIRAAFYHDARYSGAAERTITLRGEPSKLIDDAAKASSTGVGRDAGTKGAVSLAVGHPGPALTVTITCDNPETGAMVWTFEGDGLREFGLSNRKGKVQLGASPKEFLRDRFDMLAELKPGKHKPVLKGIGEDIWNVSPKEFKDLYVAIRNRVGAAFPIQFVTEEGYVPWEFMVPEGQGSDHLFLLHPVARWPFNNGMGFVHSFPPGSIASFVPEYSDDPLKQARAEQEFLVSKLGAVVGRSTYDGLMEFLTKPSGERVQVVHFAGHGRPNAGSAQSGIRMSDEWIQLEAINTDITLGTAYQPFFVLNACRMGEAQTAYGAVYGWPQRLSDRGFGGILAPLWSVEDAAASETVKRMMDRFVTGADALGETVRQARAATCDASPTAYAYLLYGDVMASIGPIKIQA